MTKQRPPRFLAERSYRRRRLVDAARLLPVVGLILVLLPILWRPAETAAPDTGFGGVYLFAVWLLLIVAALFLARILSAGETPEAGGSDEEAR